MPERDGYIPGVPCWVDASVPEPEAVLGFYRDLFGWEFENRMPPGDPQGQYHVARLPDGDVAAVGSIPEGAPPIAMWNTYIAVESADATADRVRDAGGAVAMEPFDIPGAGRMAVLTDPEGAAFCVWQAGEHKGATVVNEHGALNFNGLETRDAEGAKAFYGAVFGWTTLELPGRRRDVDPPRLRRPPGKPPARPSRPDRRRRRPAGLRGRGGEPQPDRGRSTGRAGPLERHVRRRRRPRGRRACPRAGRDVLVEPMDLPWSRLTVISDPQGATFIASQFVVENKDLGGD